MTAAAVISWLAAQGCAYPQAHLHLDSRAVGVGDVFVAVPGVSAERSADGRRFIGDAIGRGARAVLAEAQDGPQPQASVPVLAVPDLRGQLGALAAAYYDAPTTRLRTVGVTGTNGKTSCTHWIAQMLGATGERCAVHGTVGSGFVDGLLERSALTTPDPITLQRDARRFLDAGAHALAMEVSSIGLAQHRLDGVHFHIALFTNLTRDHLDYHGTMAAYGEAKRLLFDWPGLQSAVLNLDDPFGRTLADRLRARGGVAVIGCSAGAAEARGLALCLRAQAVRASAAGLAFRVGDGTHAADLELPLVGQFNVANVLGVIGVALASGVSFARAAELAPRLVPPPGRMQRIGRAGEPLAVVDYAHTPDAVAQALAALRPLAHARGGRLWVVLGAGGDRDPGKRAPMGAAAAAGADRVVVTSDNPRSEDPAAIVAAVAAGVPGSLAHNLRRIVERDEAIASAIREAAPADVVLIAGKGHEQYQEIGGERRPFSDVQQAQAALAARGSRGWSYAPAPGGAAC